MIMDHYYADKGGRKRVFLSVLKMIYKEFGEIQVLNIETRINKKDLAEKLEKEKDWLKVNTYLLQKKSFISFINCLVFLFKNIKTEKSKFILVGGGGPHTNALFSIITRIALGKRVKIIALEQGNSKAILERQPKIIQIITKIIFKKIDLVISPSRDMSISMASYFRMSKSKFKYVHNFIDIEKIQNLSAEDIPEELMEQNSINIITACRLDLKQKNILDLLRAFKLVNEKESNSNLIIMGEGPDKELIIDEARKIDICKKIKFIGHKNNPYKYISKSTIFILDTFHEGLPLVIPEAMACGCPVISSDCDFGPREIIENNESGILVPVNDYKKMAESILELINQKEKRENIIKKSKQVINLFNEKEAQKKYKYLLEELIQKK
jgi:glycosyltransferase involved in cell wall biosynthesis